MVVGAIVCELTDGFLICGLYVGILTSRLMDITHWFYNKAFDGFVQCFQ